MILVVGASGNLGGDVTRRLLRQGRAVRILAPALADHRTLVEAGAEVFLGVPKDGVSLQAACRGVRTVISAAGFDSSEDDTNLTDAAKAACVSHFVYISALGAHADSPVPNLAANARSEAHLRASGLVYTIIAPSPLMEQWPMTLIGEPVLAGLPVSLVGAGKRKHSFISSTNVAEFTVAAVDNPRAMNRRLELGGPDALSLLDVVGVYEHLLGHCVKVRRVAAGKPIPGLPVALWGAAASFELFDSLVNPAALAETTQTFGVRLSSLEVLVKRMLIAMEP